jgi:Electron transfer DM13
MPVLSVLGELETFISEELYPHRYVVSAVLVLALLAALGAAVKLGLHRALVRHPVATALVAVPVVALTLVAGDYLLSPLWERSFLEEESPITAVEAASGAQNTEAPASQAPAAQGQAAFPSTIRTGTFEGADDFHFGRGDALLIQTGPDSYVLRFENFSVRNGPDLFVYLSKEQDGRRVEESLNLGKLKATDGAFNYELPPGIDLAGIKSAVVWCKQFTVLFAHAELN